MMNSLLCLLSCLLWRPSLALALASTSTCLPYGAPCLHSACTSCARRLLLCSLSCLLSSLLSSLLPLLPSSLLPLLGLPGALAPAVAVTRWEALGAPLGARWVLRRPSASRCCAVESCARPSSRSSIREKREEEGKESPSLCRAASVRARTQLCIARSSITERQRCT